MDEQNEKSISSDNAPAPIVPSEEPAVIAEDKSVVGDVSHALANTEPVHEFESEYSADDSMRGGYASVKGNRASNNKFIWIVIAVMTVMCFAVGICSSLLTAHFMRGGEKPPVISTSGELQQNIAAVVDARKTSISEVQCGGLSASGIVMKRDGADVIVLTNAHAIAAYVTDKQAPAVRFYGEDAYYQASVIGYDGHYDVAVLSVTHDTKFTVYDLDGSEFFSSDLKYNEGDYVVSIGNAMGMGIACYDGIISKKSELLECKELFGAEGKKTVPVVRTTAVINAGMSGGGVFDMKGNLVGLGTYRLANSAGVGEEGSASTDVEDTGFATPISVLYPIYKRILADNNGGAVALASISARKTNTSAIGWLGLPFGFNCEYKQGLLTVASLDGGSPLSSVETGDVLTRIGNYEVTNDICGAIGALLSYKRRGDGAALTLALDRNGAAVPVTVNDYRYAL